MVVLFIIVVLGYVACKLGYMGDKFDKKLSSIQIQLRSICRLQFHSIGSIHIIYIL